MIRAPKHAKRIKYGTITFGVNADGTIDAPRFAAPELAAVGCHCYETEIDVRSELEKCPDHHLSIFLNARDIRDHRFERHVHYLSDQLRNYAAIHDVKTQDGHNLFEAAAADLDSLFQSLHKDGTGRIVVLSEDEKRRMALEIFDAEAVTKKKPAILVE